MATPPSSACGARPPPSTAGSGPGCPTATCEWCASYWEGCARTSARFTTAAHPGPGDQHGADGEHHHQHGADGPDVRGHVAHARTDRIGAEPEPESPHECPGRIEGKKAAGAHAVDARDPRGSEEHGQPAEAIEEALTGLEG